ncbi:Ig-like domain-containing protein [Clostridium drakei]|nr:Ig-like domain-containing protein [Clostridium drakei]
MGSVSAITATSATVTLAAAQTTAPTADKFDVEVTPEGATAATKYAVKTVTPVDGDTTNTKFVLTFEDGKTLDKTQGNLKVNGQAPATKVVTGSEYDYDFKVPEIKNVEIRDDQHIVIHFSEKMDASAAPSTTVFNTYEFTKISDQTKLIGNVGDTADQTGVLAALSADKKSVTLTLGQKMVPATYTLKVKTGAAVKDIQNNANYKVYPGTEVTVTPTADQLTDKTAPAMTKAEYDSSTKQLKLTFDSAVKDSTFAQANVLFGGIALTASDVIIDTTPDDNVLTIQLSDATAAKLNLASGANVELKAVDGQSLADANGNEVSGTMAVSLQTPPTLADATATGTSFDEASRVLTIKFNEPVKLVDASLITLDNQADVAQALSKANDTIVAGTDGTDTIKIQLSKATYDNISDNTGKTIGLVVGAGAVKDLSDTPNKAISKVEVAYAQDTTAPVFATTGAATFNNRTGELVLSFSKPVIETVSTEANVKITDGTVTKSLADLKAGGGSVVVKDNTITVKVGTELANVKGWFDAGSKVIVFTTADGDVIDYAANGLKAIASTDAKAPVVTLKDEIAPQIVTPNAVGTLSSTKFSLKFNEAMDATSANTAANYKVYDQQNDKYIACTAVQLQSDNQTVVLTFAEALTVPNNDNYKIYVNNVKDASLNRIANDSTAAFTLGTADTTAPGVNKAEFTNKDANSIEVTYTKVVNPSDAENIANYVVKDGTTAYALTNAKVTSKVTAGVTVATITFDNVIPTAKSTLTLKVNNVKDLAGNVIKVAGDADTPATAVDDNFVTIAAKTGSIDSVAPTYVATILDMGGTANDKVILTFTKDVDTTSVMNPASYAVSSSTVTGLTVASVEKYDAATKQATLVLNKNVGTANDISFNVVANKIADKAGNYVAATAQTGLAAQDLTAPTLDTVTADAKLADKSDVITLKFNKDVYENTTGTALAPADLSKYFTVKVGNTTLTGSDLDAYFTELGSGSTFTLTTQSGKEIKNGDVITVTLNSGKVLYDASQNPVSSITKTVTATTTETALALGTGHTADGSKITLKLNHAIDPATLKADGSDFVVPGYIIKNAVLANTNQDVVLTLANAIPASTKINVSLADNANICDLVGSKLVISTPVEITSAAAATPAAALTATATQGSVTGSTAITATPTGTNTLVYKVSSTAVTTPNVGDTVSGTSALTSGADITGVDDTTNKYVAVYELDGSNKIVSFKLITLTSAEIK